MSIEAINAYGIVPQHRLTFENNPPQDIGRKQGTTTVTGSPTFGSGGVKGKSTVEKTGSTDAIDIDGSTTLDIGDKDFTCAIWVNLITLGTQTQQIISKGDSTSNVFDVAWGLGLQKIFVSNNNSGLLVASSTVHMAANTWVLITVTYSYSNTRMKIYENGTEVGSSNSVTTNLSGTDGIKWRLLERAAGGTNDFVNGSKIADFYVFDYELTSTEVNNLYLFDSTIPVERDAINKPEPVRLWNTLNSVNEIENSNIGSDGVITGTLTFADTKFSQSPLFDSTSKKVIFPEVLDDIRERGTIEYWWKPTYNNNVGTSAVHFSNNFNNSEFLLIHGTGGIGMRVGGGSLVNQSFSTVANQLYHIGFTWDINGIDGGSDTMRLYKDNSLFSSSTQSISSMNTSATDIVCGLNSNNTLPATAYIDNIKIYNHAKTDFSDKEQERPSITYKKNIEVSNDRLVSWNKLGSAGEITDPPIGTTWTNDITGSNFTGDGYFDGKTLFVPDTGFSDGETCIMDNRVLFAKNGCIEFWFKADGWNIVNGSISGGSGAANKIWIYGDRTISSPYGYLQFLPIGVGAGIRFRTFSSSLSNGKNLDTGSSYSLTTNGVWNHAACVWSADNEWKRIYINGSQVAEDTGYTSTYHFADNLTGLIKIGTVTSTESVDWSTIGAEGWFDNIKIHNYAKTDFSDRFNEAPINIKEVDV